MKKARLQDGQIVLAHQYNKAAHGTHLRCADPDCSADMLYRRETLTHGASALRAASFVSKSISDHIAHCTAHEDFAIMAKQKKSIEQALREGKAVVLNLNMRLTENFNAAAIQQNLVGVASTHEKRDYATAAVKSVEDFLDLLTMIEDKGGRKALDNTVVNYKGKTLPVMDFVIDTKDKYRDLLNTMYKSVDGAKPRADITDFPRLIRFRATQNTKQRETGALRGTPVTFLKGRGNRLILLQKAEVEKEFSQTLRGENVFIIATPTLRVTEAQAALSKLQTQTEQTVFLNLNWKVVGAHQFTPVEERAPDSPQPKTQPGQQSLFKF